MKRILAILMALVPMVVTAQQLDYRATLWVASRAQAYSLAPDGRLWMATRVGEVFYADSIGGLWHVVKLPRSTDRREDYTIDHVFTPDSHTVVLAGYIYAPNNSHCTGNYIISSDGGRTWDFRSLDTCSEWIDESWHTADGRIWMGGLSGRLLYSDDHGQTFRVIHRTDTAGDRLGGLWLDTAGLQGILAVLGNKLYLTDDGFRTVRRITTPKGQGALVLDRQNWYGKIWSAFQWRQWLFVDQEHRWFYAHRDTLQWHPCPLTFGSWALSPDGDTLTVMSTEGLAVMESPTEWRKISDANGSIIYSDGSHVLLTTYDALLTVNPDGTTATYPFLTTDYPIEEPPHWRQVCFKGHQWGYDGNDIYMKKGKRWGRVAHTDFYIHDMRVADTCLLVESANEVYSITDRRTQLVPIRYEHPLDRFLKAKTVELTIVSTSIGCFHHNRDSVCYRRMPALDHELARDGGDRFRLVAYSLHDTVLPLPIRFFEADDLEALLADFDRQPQRPVHRDELGVSAADLQALMADSTNKSWHSTTPRVLRQVAEGFDTISNALISSVFSADEGFSSTTTQSITVRMVNAAGDTLILRRSFFGSTPYMLPFHVTVGDRSLFASHLPLMQFIGEKMPPEMMFARHFTPLAFLRRLASDLDTNR